MNPKYVGFGRLFCMDCEEPLKWLGRGRPPLRCPTHAAEHRTRYLRDAKRRERAS